MKRKILAIGLFGLCALGFFAADAKAFFGLLSPYHPSSLWHRHNRYVTQITVRPYNAFTPICWGNMVCDGCNPSPCGVACGQMPMTMGAPPWASPCPGYGPGPGCCGPDMGGYMASDMPLMMPPSFGPPPSYGPPPTYAPPEIRNQPNWMPPVPNPAPPGPGMTMYPYQGVAQANYYPMYPQQYPNYYMPTYYNPYMNMQPAPYYWYGGR